MNRIKILREQKGISQQTLADMFNLSQQSIYKYENELAEPSIRTLKDLADYFHTTIDYIVGYTDNPSRPYESVDIQYSPIELQHLDMYCQLTPSLQNGIDVLIEKIIKEQETASPSSL